MIKLINHPPNQEQKIRFLTNITKKAHFSLLRTDFAKNRKYFVSQRTLCYIQSISERTFISKSEWRSALRSYFALLKMKHLF